MVRLGSDGTICKVQHYFSLPYRFMRECFEPLSM